MRLPINLIFLLNFLSEGANKILKFKMPECYVAVIQQFLNCWEFFGISLKAIFQNFFTSGKSGLSSFVGK
jgi:hypothetical protein